MADEKRRCCTGARNKFGWKKVTLPPLKPGEVRIQIEARAGTCGTDLKVFKGAVTTPR